ncbi:class I SAM-dependent methyltransferase [Consotaella salsifontis]|uniref:tRNA (Cmo5U34)-methyltransferase n=1 Tax=Consotaella salsifontis TaxID=1365950 RepID=A0A1T4RSJ9_9HYPH|nr:class I SAM-dependent methyltransferase [Consotaella salsifontis]SKA18621.1 tRNA (cmo5U34)-methyltransferase [Consotaella salsifontis]
MNDQHPSSSRATVLFNQEMAESYDEKNRKLAAISDNMHFLFRLVLEDLPRDARILCVGAGTGAEILALAKTFPEWSFVGVDPSEQMLRVCRDRLEKAGVLDRCDLITGYVEDAPGGAEFDAVLSVLVAHFISRSDRPGFYRNVHNRLKPGGFFISTEISFDLDSAEFPSMLKNWERVQELMGATPDSLKNLPEALREKLSILSPAETETALRQNGFDLPVPFFQSFMIHGWYAVKQGA